MQIDKPSHVWQLSFQGDWVTSVAFLGDARLAAGNRLGQIFLWDLSHGSSKKSAAPTDLPPQRQLAGHTNCVSRLVALPDGKSLVSASLDHSIRIWDVNAAPSGKAQVVLDADLRERKARGKSKQEKEKVLQAPGATVELTPATATLEGHQNWIRTLGISADGRRLISGDDSCLSIVWDLASRKPVSRWKGSPQVWVTSAALSPDGKTAFTGEFAGRRGDFDRPAAQARLWNTADGSLKLDLLKVWTPGVKDKDRVNSYGYSRTWGKLIKRGLVCADFSPDGKLLAVGQGGETDTGKVHLVDVASGKIVRTVSGHRYGCCDVKFSADGKYVVSSGRDTTVRICQVADGKEVAALGKSRGGQFKDWLHAVAVSPNQQWLAAADIAGFVQVWRLKR